MEPNFPRSLGRVAHFRSVPFNARPSVRGPQSLGVGRSRIGVAIRCGMLKWPYRDRAFPISDAVDIVVAVPAPPLCHHRARRRRTPLMREAVCYADPPLLPARRRSRPVRRRDRCSRAATATRRPPPLGASHDRHFSVVPPTRCRDNQYQVEVTRSLGRRRSSGSVSSVQPRHQGPAETAGVVRCSPHLVAAPRSGRRRRLADT